MLVSLLIIIHPLKTHLSQSVYIPGIGDFNQTVTLEGGETRKVFFDNSSYPLLNVHDPILWWPWQMGSPYLYTLNTSFSINDCIFFVEFRNLFFIIVNS